MKVLNFITRNVKNIGTVALVLGAALAAINAFTKYWDENFGGESNEAVSN